MIWHALREATLRREQLAGLRSWSTVGTPFLQHRTRSAWHFANIVNLLLAIALLRPALFTLRKLALLTVSALSGQDHAIVLNNGVPPRWQPREAPSCDCSNHLASRSLPRQTASNWAVLIQQQEGPFSNTCSSVRKAG